MLLHKVSSVFERRRWRWWWREWRQRQRQRQRQRRRCQQQKSSFHRSIHDDGKYFTTYTNVTKQKRIAAGCCHCRHRRRHRAHSTKVNIYPFTAASVTTTMVVGMWGSQYACGRMCLCVLEERWRISLSLVCWNVLSSPPLFPCLPLHVRVYAETMLVLDKLLARELK